MDRIYYRFPQKIDFEQRYGFNGDLKYLARVMASMYGKSGHMEIDTLGPNVKRNPDAIKARRDIKVDIVQNRLDFVPLSQVDAAEGASHDTGRAARSISSSRSATPTWTGTTIRCHWSTTYSWSGLP